MQSYQEFIGGLYGQKTKGKPSADHPRRRILPESQRAQNSRQGLHPETLITGIKNNPGKALAAWLAVTLALRIGLSTTHAGYLGVDGGAYLLSLGDPHEVSFLRPPLAPGWLLWPFMEWIGGPLGFNLYAAVFSMAVLPGFYLLARRLLGPGWGAAATFCLTLDWPLAEMFVTGVVPITSFGFLALLLWGMVVVKEKPLLGPATIALAAPLIAFTNQTTLGLSLVTVPIALLVLPHKTRNALALGAGALLALSALPWYIDVLPGQPRVSYPGPLLYLNPWWSAQWHQLGACLIVGIATLRAQPPTALRLAAYLVLVHGLLQVALSYDEAIINILFRSSYWVQLPLWICAAWLVRRFLETHSVPTPALTGATALFLTLGLGGFGFQFWNQANNYSVLMGPEHLKALESIPRDDITRIGTNAESRGFYLGAITGKPVAWVQAALPAGSYQERERQARCSIGWIATCADKTYLSHFLVDTNNRQQQTVAIDAAPDRMNPWASLDQVPWLTKTYEEGTVKVYTVATP